MLVEGTPVNGIINCMMGTTGQVAPVILWLAVCAGLVARRLYFHLYIDRISIAADGLHLEGVYSRHRWHTSQYITALSAIHTGIDRVLCCAAITGAQCG